MMAPVCSQEDRSVLRCVTIWDWRHWVTTGRAGSPCCATCWRTCLVNKASSEDTTQPVFKGHGGGREDRCLFCFSSSRLACLCISYIARWFTTLTSRLGSTVHQYLTFPTSTFSSPASAAFVRKESRKNPQMTAWSHLSPCCRATHLGIGSNRCLRCVNADTRNRTGRVHRGAAHESTHCPVAARRKYRRADDVTIALFLFEIK